MTDIIVIILLLAPSSLAAGDTCSRLPPNSVTESSARMFRDDLIVRDIGPEFWNVWRDVEFSPVFRIGWIQFNMEIGP